jgi:hypothetical protein
MHHTNLSALQHFETSIINHVPAAAAVAISTTTNT